MSTAATNNIRSSSDVIDCIEFGGDDVDDDEVGDIDDEDDGCTQVQ